MPTKPSERTLLAGTMILIGAVAISTVLSGCQSCPTIGCPPQLQIDVVDENGDPVLEPISGTVTVDSEEIPFHCDPEGRGSRAIANCAFNGPKILIFGRAPVERLVQVQISQDDTLRSTQFGLTVASETIFPGGEGCAACDLDTGTVVLSRLLSPEECDLGCQENAPAPPPGYDVATTCYDGCNWCTCTVDGLDACTARFCP